MKKQGFTLLELMMVVSIIATLLVVAIPSFQAQLAQSQRTEAMVYLARLANAQEHYYAESLSYTANMEHLGGSADPWILPGGDYSVDATAANSEGFVLKATALGNQKQIDSDCQELTLNELGQGLPASCWN